MEKKRIIVDLSSIAWTCLLAGIDKEFGKTVEFEGKPFQVNSATYGFENAINHFVAMLNTLDLTPMNMILVIEGLNSKLLRTNIMPNYKGGATGRSRPEEAYEEFRKLRDQLVSTFLLLGASAVKQDGIESDDVIGYLALNLHGTRYIDSNDGDMAVLMDDHRLPEDRKIKLFKFGKGLVEENPIGPFPCKYITVYKALCGDTSDKIPGARGFGPKAWLDLIVNFGYDGLELMEELIRRKKLDDLVEDVPQLKVLQKVIDDAPGVYASYACARLYPEKINTFRKPLEWSVGMVKPRTEETDERLKHWAGAVRLVHKANFESAFAWFKSKLPESPFVATDLETSANDTAEEWMETAKAKSGGDDNDNIGVDVFGAEITGFSVTFGCNLQYTFYVTVDHVEEDDVKNVSMADAKRLLEAIPQDKRNAIQNVAFELPVIMTNMGELDQVETCEP